MKRAIGTLLVVIICVPFVSGMPLVPSGLQDLNAIRYIDEGSYAILQAWKDVYAQGPFSHASFNPDYIYPKSFYNLAGLFLYPYSLLKGASPQVMMMTWRFLGILFEMGAIGLLFFLVRRLFHSDTAGLIAAALFAVTPEFLFGYLGVRPNPMEIAATFASFTLIALLCERFTMRRFLGSVFFGAVAFSAKYGAVPFVLLLPLLATYLLVCQQDRSKLNAFAAKHSKLFRSFAWTLAAVATVGFLLFAWEFFQKGLDGSALFLEGTSFVFPPDLLPKVVHRITQWSFLVNSFCWGLLFFLLFIALFSVALPTLRSKMILFLFGNFFVQTLLIYFGIFVITNPAYFLHFDHFLSEFGYFVYYLLLGGSYTGMTLPSPVEVLRLTAQEMPAWFVGLPLFAYYLYLEFRLKIFPVEQRKARLFFAIYVLGTLSLFLATPTPSLRHILPAVGLFFGFAASAMAVSLRQKFGVGVVGLLLLIYGGLNLYADGIRWQRRMTNDRDIGFTVGRWIQDHYDPSTKILKDSFSYYLPPKFINVLPTTYEERKGKTNQEKKSLVLDLVEKYDPQLVIVTYSPIYRREIDVRELLNGEDFKLVRRFESQRSVDFIKWVEVFQKEGESSTL